jgi:hypothetical protein
MKAKRRNALALFRPRLAAKARYRVKGRAWECVAIVFGGASLARQRIRENPRGVSFQSGTGVTF